VVGHSPVARRGAKIVNERVYLRGINRGLRANRWWHWALFYRHKKTLITEVIRVFEDGS